MVPATTSPEYVDFLRAVFPGARFIVNTRDHEAVLAQQVLAQQAPRRPPRAPARSRSSRLAGGLGDDAFHVHFDDYVRRPGLAGRPVRVARRAVRRGGGPRRDVRQALVLSSRGRSRVRWRPLAPWSHEASARRAHRPRADPPRSAVPRLLEFLFVPASAQLGPAVPVRPGRRVRRGGEPRRAEAARARRSAVQHGVAGPPGDVVQRPLVPRVHHRGLRGGEPLELPAEPRLDVPQRRQLVVLAGGVRPVPGARPRARWC